MQTNNSIPNPTQQISSLQPPNTSPKKQSDNILQSMQESNQRKKSNRWLIVGLVAFTAAALGTAGIFAYQNYQLKQRVSQPKPSPSAVLPTPLPTSNQKQDGLETIEWLTYADEKVPKLVFKYPKRGVIKVKRDQPEGNYTLEMIYENLRLEVDTVMGGVGGRSYPPRSFYSIIYGNHYEGIGKNISKNQSDDQITISYFRFSSGGLEFGHFLIGTSTFTFNMPSNLQTKYEAIADIIACSTHDVEPNDKGLFAKAYHDPDTNSVIGVNPDKSTYIILQGDPTINEQIDGFVINPTAEYLVIDTSIGVESELYGRVYDLNQKRFLSFDGVEKRPKICCLAKWTSDYIFTSPDKDDDGKYKGDFEYDIKRGTRRSLKRD